MANYPIKMLKDEENTPFVPLVSTQGIQSPSGQTLDQILQTKLGPANLHGGYNTTVRTEGYDCYIDVQFPSGLNLINNLTTTSSNQGALDAYQGKVLNDKITGYFPVSIANGGTGQTTGKNAINSLINQLDSANGTPNDSDYYVCQSNTSGDTTYRRRSMTALWTWASNKISNNLGLTASNYSGTAAKATADSSGNTISSTYLKLSGGTMTGQLKSSKTGEDAILISHGTGGIASGVMCTRTDTDTSVSLQVGSGGVNHGIYSHKLNKWMLYSDGTNVIANLSYPQDRVFIGSQVIYDGLSGSGTVSKTSVIGAYDYNLIEGIFDGVTIPSGWHREYRVTFQSTNSNDGSIKIHINNIQSSGVQTWSGDTFRKIGSTAFFKESDIVLTKTHGYSSNGTNLYYESTTAGTWHFWNVTVHGYLVRN